MNSSIKVDRISLLPKNVIDSILTRLTILEAMHTSILLRSWRYQWHSLSKISIDLDLLPVSQVEHVKFIDHILFVHCGSIDKFELHIRLVKDNDINRWILYLSRNGIKELIIDNDGDSCYNLPSCIVSCSELMILYLTKCIFKLPAAAFKPFNKLKDLLLAQVEIMNMSLEILVNSCPRLRVLVLIEVQRCSSLKINAPKLLTFHIRGYCCYSQFKNTPRLTFAYFSLESPVSSHAADNDCKIVELFGSMPILRRLEFHEFALQHLAVGNIPARLPLICRIKRMEVCINFEDLQELLAAFCIFRSSPSLQHLALRVFGDKNTSRISANGFWEGEQDLNFKFDHLQEARVTSFTGNETELKFIEFLLANAPALKTIEIEFSVGKGLKDLLTIVRKLVRFPRVSPIAELILPPF